eukprot:417992_1
MVFIINCTKFKMDTLCNFLYCNSCLTDSVKQNNSTCPINGHIDPIIIPTRASRRQISKATVFCPYSITSNSVNNEFIKKKDCEIIDTAGGDQKEGFQSQINIGCIWKGTLYDLINNHIEACTEKYNPLANDNENLNQQVPSLIKIKHFHIEEKKEEKEYVMVEMMNTMMNVNPLSMSE